MLVRAMSCIQDSDWIARFALDFARHVGRARGRWIQNVPATGRKTCPKPRRVVVGPRGGRARSGPGHSLIRRQDGDGWICRVWLCRAKHLNASLADSTCSGQSKVLIQVSGTDRGCLFLASLASESRFLICCMQCGCWMTVTPRKLLQPCRHAVIR